MKREAINESAPRREQLNGDELEQIRWALGGLLTLLSVATVFYLEIEATILMTLTAIGAGLALARPTWPARVPRVVHLLAFPVIVVVFVLDLWLSGQVLPPTVRLDVLLLLYRGICYRQRRDDLQIIVLGLFLIVMAGVLTVALAFAVHLLAFTAVALGLLLVNTLTEAPVGGHRPPLQKNEVPPWARHLGWRRLVQRVRAVADWRVLVLGGGLFAGVVAVSALLFLAIPRFQLENSLFLDRLASKKAKSGFNDSIKFGDVTEIQQDNSIALTVDVSDPTRVPGTPYWRMLTLDEYREGTFRLSITMKRDTFARERTGVTVRGDGRMRTGENLLWIFYLEPGISRYLPLLGRFQTLQFGEVQNFRYASELSVMELRNEPVSMTAYRVEDMMVGDSLPDPGFAAKWRSRETGATMPLMTKLGVSEADRAQLRTLLQSTGAAEQTHAAEFFKSVGAWLRLRHAYSLEPKIPSGPGDALVRWANSTEAGHCELFAGSFVLLARTAGFPARVVTGFKGGTWNAYSGNFTVRNSNAHAWAEIWDAEHGAWLRADPLDTGADAAAANQPGDAALAGRTDRSWSARLDSLRVFWYRRIVSFDQRTQEETLKAVKAATQGAGEKLRVLFSGWLRETRTWLARPWDSSRVVITLVSGLGAMAAAWGLWRLGRVVRGWRFKHGSEDPVRQEASRWLGRIADGKDPSVKNDLQRLRFGRRDTWGRPEEIFKRARREWRNQRKKDRGAHETHERTRKS